LYKKNISFKKDCFEQLSAAIIKNSPVSFMYSNKLRVVNPYKLINNNSIWYLLADENNQLKNFTFSKVAILHLPQGMINQKL